MLEHKHVLNQDLVLRVDTNIDPSVFDLNKYEGFIDALCGDREYQKEAIRTTLNYFLGGQYQDLAELAEDNLNNNASLQHFYGSFHGMKEHLQIPNKLSCSIDLATATGKSWVIYGIARIMLAEGSVDSVLVICPSVTIESGLMDKFTTFSGDNTLRQLLPEDSAIKNPHIINATETITTGCICVENCHALYEHVQSSIRESLAGKGERTLLINDETHHVYNQTGKAFKKWKEFLLDENFDFEYIVGLSGTCYMKDEYFSDVIHRYSLRQAIEEGYVKSIDYVARDTSTTQNEKLQKIYDNHAENRSTKYRLLKPLTILVTKSIKGCDRITDDLIDFLASKEGISREEASQKVLEVTSSPRHAENVQRLAYVDRMDFPVEWITSVSMLTEGWDVNNVFQIVPHEERAFDSKLLIAQVLGRGLRVPPEYRGQRPVVTVFNHDRWSGRIKHLVDEVLEIEKRIYSYPVRKEPDYNFVVHTIDYDVLQEIEKYKQEREYEFQKDHISLTSQARVAERETEYVRAITGDERRKKTLIEYQMFPVEGIVDQLHKRFKSIDMENEDAGNPTNYAEKYSENWLEKLVTESLRRIDVKDGMVREDNRQRIFQAFGVLQRKGAKVVRYKMSPKAIMEIHTEDRKRNSVAFSSIRRGEATVFWDNNFPSLCTEEDIDFIKELEELKDELPGSAMQKVPNKFDFKTPLGIVLTSHKPERLFVRELIKEENSQVINAWVKSTDQDFYPIEYAWKKGEHPKRGSFNPDFFLKIVEYILVVEIKDDGEIAQPSDENKAKYRAAKLHFSTLNDHQSEVTYFFNFLTPADYESYFDQLRKGKFHFVSQLDAALKD